MDKSLSFKERIQRVERLLGYKEYTPAVRESVIAIELALKRLLLNDLNRLESGIKRDIEEMVRKQVGRRPGLEQFAMGEIVHILRESGFLKDWARASGKDISVVKTLDFDNLTRLRNKFIHGETEATRDEADYLASSLSMILRTFDMGSFSAKPDHASEHSRVSQGSQMTNISIGSIGGDFNKDVENVSHTYFGPQVQQSSQAMDVQNFREEFMTRLSAIQAEVARIRLPEEDKKEIEHELKGAEMQAKKEPPNKDKMVDTLSNAQKVVKGIASLGSEAVTLANLIAQAIHWVTETWQKIL